MVDLLGFAGSGLIVLSLTMKSIVRLRIVGLAGAMIFVSYGLLLGAWPVVVTNIVTLSIHIFRLRGAIAEQAGLDTPDLGPVPLPVPVPVRSGRRRRLR